MSSWQRVFNDKYQLASLVTDLINIKKGKSDHNESKEASLTGSRVAHTGEKHEDDDSALDEAISYHASIKGEDENSNDFHYEQAVANVHPHVDTDDNAAMLRVRVQSPESVTRHFGKGVNSPSWMTERTEQPTLRSPSHKVGSLAPLNHVSPIKSIVNSNSASALLKSESKRKLPTLRSLSINFADDDVSSTSSPARVGRKSPSRLGGTSSPMKKGSPSRRVVPPTSQKLSTATKLSSGEQLVANPSTIPPRGGRKGSLLVLPSTLNMAAKISVHTRIQTHENRSVATSAINPGLHLVLDAEDQKKISRRNL